VSIRRTSALYSNVERGTADRHLQYLFWKIFIEGWQRGVSRNPSTSVESLEPPGGLPRVDSFENGRRLRTNEAWIPHAESDSVGPSLGPFSKSARRGEPTD
jgi:hypothetical protein